jgi:DsbC/DsbD-like thiol-disulfide interchange protein
LWLQWRSHFPTIEATSVITLRLQVLPQGGKAAEAEALLMVTEKMKAFAQARSDLADGASLAQVHANF